MFYAFSPDADLEVTLAGLRVAGGKEARKASITSKQVKRLLRLSAASEQPKGPNFQELDSDKDLIPTRVNRTALLRTCRQVYLDAVNLLYQPATLFFDRHIVFTTFEQVVGHHNFNHIRHLQLEFKMQFQNEPNRLYELYNSTTWGTLWSTIAGMSHLQTLKVDLNLFVLPSMIRPAFKDHCRPILEPLLSLRGLKEFDLKMAYWAQWLWKSPRPGRSGGPIIDLQLPSQTVALVEEVKKQLHNHEKPPITNLFPWLSSIRKTTWRKRFNFSLPRRPSSQKSMQTNNQSSRVSAGNPSAPLARAQNERIRITASAPFLVYRIPKKQTTGESSTTNEDDFIRTEQIWGSEPHCPLKALANGESSTRNIIVNSAAKPDDSIANIGPDTTDSLAPGPATAFEQSSLRRLPLELRLQIYNLVLTPDNTGFPLFSAGLPYSKPPEILFWDHISVKSLVHSGSKRPALLRTCRQIYTESIDLLYQQRKFVITRKYVFQAFAAMVPRHLDKIRHILLRLRG
ncbi:MAG: hypothetical protein Q9221_008456 [Calogaya cf. arnoldii]